MALLNSNAAPFDINEINAVFKSIISKHGKRGEQIQEEFFEELKRLRKDKQVLYIDYESALKISDYSDIHIFGAKSKAAPAQSVMVDVWDAINKERVQRNYCVGSTKNVIVGVDVLHEDDETIYLIHEPFGISEYSTWASVENMFEKEKWIGEWLATEERPKSSTMQWEDDLDTGGDNETDDIVDMLRGNFLNATTTANQLYAIGSSRNSGKSIFNNMALIQQLIKQYP